MPYVNNQGVSIFYEIEGQGRPLLLQYGQYIPHEIWRHLGYVDALKNNFLLIMVDARGQGDSDQPEDIQAYTEETMVGDLLCVMDHLGLQQAGYMGYSSGGGLGYGLACRAPERVSALIIGGCGPGHDKEGQRAFAEAQMKSLKDQTSEDFAKEFETFLSTTPCPPVTPQLHAALLKQNPKALVAWHWAAVDYPSYVDCLPRMTMPCLVFVGDQEEGWERVQRRFVGMSNVNFIVIPGGMHFEDGTWVNILRPEIMTLFHT